MQHKNQNTYVAAGNDTLHTGTYPRGTKYIHTVGCSSSDSRCSPSLKLCLPAEQDFSLHSSCFVSFISTRKHKKSSSLPSILVFEAPVVFTKPRLVVFARLLLLFRRLQDGGLVAHSKVWTRPSSVDTGTTAV